MPYNFSGQVILVAGGTGGLGRSVSIAFLDAGATVAVTYRHAEEFDALRSAAGANAARLEGHAVDVMDETAVKDLVGGLVGRHGRLDAMVNAVGGYDAGAPLWEMETGVLDKMLSLNLRSGYLLARAGVPAMLKQGHGALVNVAATAAFNHMPAAGAYVASKAAAVAMIDSLAADLKGSGVRANSICPSIIDTEANRKAMPDADHSKWPKPAEIARVVLFLCSEDAKLVHGAAIPV
jgi:NAD(P)-dependent dehydrogenase (short-subunit alcohol dehydrogenase family)